MQWTLPQSQNGDEEIKRSTNTMIRFFTVARTFSDEPKKNCYGTWNQCNPSTSKDFGAVAYYFGKVLSDALHVPVGLINSSWGGTPAEAWTRNEVLQANPELEVYIKRCRENAERTKPGDLPFNQN